MTAVDLPALPTSKQRLGDRSNASAT